MIRYEKLLPHVPGHLGASAMRAGGFLLATLLCLSFFWSLANPFTLKILVAGVGVLAAIRPAVALLTLAAIVPFGRVLSNLASPAEPVGFTEALVLAYLAGWLWHRLRRGVHEGLDSPGLVLSYLFAALAVASLLVDIGVFRYWRDYWWPFLRQLLAYCARDYLNVGVESRPWANSFGGFASAFTAARLLEGIALARAAQVLCAERTGFGRRLLVTLTLAAAGAAFMSLEAALQGAAAERGSLLSVFQKSRIAAHVAKINTAASYFVLSIPVLVGLGVAWARALPRTASIRALRWTVTAAGAGLLSAALWLTGTRAAMTAGAAVAIGASGYAVSGRRQGRRTSGWAIGIVAACGVVCGLLVFGFYMRTAALEEAGASHGSLPVRVLMWQAALRTLAARPLFGVGIGQFQYRIAEFDPEAVLPANVGLSRFNAHNQFLEVAAELGVIGGLLFVGMFAAILWRAWRAFRTSHDPMLGGAIAGVVAFLITCLGGQPLLYDVVAVPFWMVLGVLLAAGDTVPDAASPEQTAASRRRRGRVLAGFMIFLALSIPVRVWQGKDQVNFALVRYGFSRLYQPKGEQPYRLVRNEGAFFTYPHALRIKVPIRRDALAGRNRLEVDVLLDGRRARTLVLADDEWQSAEFTIPADANRRFRRVDLLARAPAGVAAQVRVAPAEITEDEALERGRSR